MASKSRVRRARPCIPILAVMTLASAVFAADEVFDARGFNPDRETSSQFPWEHIDPMTGNLLLTFTDLALPGNAGFDLKIQRTYNSKIFWGWGPVTEVFEEDSWAGIGWSLHMGRVLNPGSTTPGPVIEMPDVFLAGDERTPRVRE